MADGEKGKSEHQRIFPLNGDRAASGQINPRGARRGSEEKPRTPGNPEGVSGCVSNNEQAFLASSTQCWPSSFLGCLTGHKFCGRALCLDETRYEQRTPSSTSSCCSIGPGSGIGRERSTGIFVTKSSSLERLFPGIETLIDQKIRIAMSMHAA